jgi:trehalose utilization protein
VHLVGPDPQEDVVTGVFHGGYVRRNGLTHSGGGSVDPYHYLIRVRLSWSDGSSVVSLVF